MKKLVVLKRFPVIFALFLISLNNIFYTYLDNKKQKTPCNRRQSITWR
ncbi:hypothetical protein SPHINGO8BC_150494 [Sphingobacterium multivorum]|uniref:Uncharacterized protein n=1 Tax=Sphingobacterium multivorum TaxID=28454 RepID=A0A654AMB5_SPHMU|nr:hypothetical protein SPHINGO8BC_150494 [Sphingobacterium multivorum]